MTNPSIYNSKEQNKFPAFLECGLKKSIQLKYNQARKCMGHIVQLLLHKLHLNILAIILWGCKLMGTSLLYISHPCCYVNLIRILSLFYKVILDKGIYFVLQEKSVGSHFLVFIAKSEIYSAAYCWCIW